MGLCQQHLARRSFLSVKPPKACPSDLFGGCPLFDGTGTVAGVLVLGSIRCANARRGGATLPHITHFASRQSAGVQTRRDHFQGLRPSMVQAIHGCSQSAHKQSTRRFRGSLSRARLTVRCRTKRPGADVRAISLNSSSSTSWPDGAYRTPDW